MTTDTLLDRIDHPEPASVDALRRLDVDALQQINRLLLSAVRADRALAQTLPFRAGRDLLQTESYRTARDLQGWVAAALIVKAGL
jgi:hypothetical protein